MTEEKTTAEKFLELQGSLAVLFILTLTLGFVLRDFWLWFLVPLGVKPIGIAWAMGMSVMIRMVTASGAVDRKKASNGEQLAFGMFLAGLFLLIGYLCHLAM